MNGSAPSLNLLPLPRHVDLDGGTVSPAVSSRPPAAAHDTSVPLQGYRLSITDGGVRIHSADPAGERYARTTLEQLRATHPAGLPSGTISDHPDLAVRAVMLDISRDKVPTMATFEALIDRLASWKVNQVQLYMEHTFAYRDHEEVWRRASPLTADEVRHLDAFCRDRFIDLVPNQNCFGHFDRWLRHERYRQLAMAPDGYRNPKGTLRPPSTLDPSKPEALELVRSLLAEMVPCFGGHQVHVGMDEPWEMPAERYPEYLGWVNALRALPELDGREMLIWGDIVATRPDTLTQLPAGVTVCEWGYEDWHPFAERAEGLSRSGVPYWLCPGTSSWLSILGRVDNMKGDCVVAAEAALAHGAAGWLNTDWGDRGHLQYLPVSEPGFAYGAAVSWCLDANRDIDLAAALDAHAFGDSAGELGAALVALGNAYKGVEPQMINMSILVTHLYFPQLQLGRSFSKGLTIEDLGATQDRIAHAVAALDRVRATRADAVLVLDELRAGADLVTLMCDDARERMGTDGWLASVPEASRLELAKRLDQVMERHRQLWLARNRPGGLEDSLSVLSHLAHCYRTGTVDPNWGDW